MVTFSVYAFQRVPPDAPARLAQLGLRVDETGRAATVFGDTLVVRDGMGNFPARLVAHTLGCTQMFHAEAGFEFVRGGAEVAWDVATVDLPAGSRRTLRQGKESFPAADVGREPETIARRYADQAMDGVIEDVVPAGTKARTFGVSVPRGWRPADPFAEATRGPPSVTWRSTERAANLDLTTLAWISERLRAAGRLDERTAPPDLTRWRHRLLKRHPTEDSPAWREDWVRLTRPERAAVSPLARAVLAWKLTLGTAILTASEVASLREVLGLPGASPPQGIAEIVAELLAVLDAGEEIVVEPW